MGRGRGGRGRGRPSSAKNNPTGEGGTEGEGASSSGSANNLSRIKGKSSLSATVMKRLAKSLIPYENDDEMVQCHECEGMEMTYRQFRLHNLQYHMNTAATTEEKPDMLMDHKYFARKLNEYKKITKATVFDCPRINCTSSFKSTLGLAYHMNTCGRSAEEIDSVLLECDICHAKFTLPNLQWHKKSHTEPQNQNLITLQPGDELKQLNQASSSSTKKRIAAINARKTLRRVGATNDEDPFERRQSGEDSDDDDRFNVPTDPLSTTPSRTVNNQKSLARIDRDNHDYTILAQNFLETIDSDGRAWDDPLRNDDDIFLEMADNKLENENIDEIESYLPHHKKSFEFKYVTEDGSSDYHRLPWFEGEAASSTSPNCLATLFYSGGPVLSLSWHQSGKLLAVSTGNNLAEEIDVLRTKNRKSCIQIYSCSQNNLFLRLQLVIGVKWGYVTNIQWSSFCPDIMDSYNPNDNKNFEDVEIYCRIGYLAMACEDSTIRIMSIRIEDFKLTPNYEYKPGHKVRVCTKTPEICLKIHESVDDEVGNVTKFDWHEKQRFLAAGYANGMIAIYDLQTKSDLLKETITVGSDKVTVINPFWVFQGHKLPIKGICFDPRDPRYLVTASQDRTLKIWDVNTRMMRESKRIGICLDMCWIRGWIHQALSVESHVAYQSAMHNYVRVFSIGSSVGRPTTADLANFASLDFYHGLTAQGTDDGKVNVSYYDWFWRECDYDRNRKKKNFAILSTLKIDPSSYTKLSTSDFVVNLKKLRKGVYSSKGFQRLGLQEEDSVYSVTLEGKFGGPSIFDNLPDPDDDDFEQEDDKVENYERQQATTQTDQGRNTTNNNDKEEDFVVEDALNAVHQPKQMDGLLPVCDVNIREEEPKVVISFLKQRPNTAVPSGGVDDRTLEEYVRFQPFMRINKISWSPNGKIIAVGYRNGLISLLPGDFENIFTKGSGRDLHIH